MSERICVGVVGVGEFGRNHVRVYRDLENAELVGVFDTNAALAEKVAREFGTRAFPSLEELAGLVQAASLAVPTRDHARVGVDFLRRGVDVLVEKPMAASLAEADQLVDTAREHSRILQIGHTERFNPAVTTAATVLDNPLFFEVHRLGVFSGRSLDVDVIFDLMIHDLDILLSFVDAPVEQVHAAGIPILSDKVDIASVRLEFANGCVANLTASRVSTEKVRKLRCFQPHAYISVDYARRDVLMISVEKDAAAQLAAQAATGLPPGLPAGLNARKIETPDEEPLHAELRAFLEAVRTRTPGPASGEEGRRALELAERVAAGIKEQRGKVASKLASARV